MQLDRRDAFIIGISLIVGSLITIMYDVLQDLLKTYVFQNATVDMSITIKAFAGIFSLLVGLVYLILFTQRGKPNKKSNPKS